MIRQLRAIGVPPTDELEAGPPAKVPGLLRLLNKELKALIVEDLNDQNGHAVPGEDEILEQLTAAGWEEIPSHKWNAYGEIRQIKFDFKVGYEPGILIVSTQLWLPCGSADSDFDPAGEKDESGLQYQISPPDSRGHWFLVVAHVLPSCRRTPSVLRYEILRPGVNAEKPRLLLSGREAIHPFFQPAFRINVEVDWFAVTNGKLRKLDGELGVGIARYELADSQVRQVAPVALTPEDFLDQWVQMSWDDARQWTKSSSDSGLQEWHSKLNGIVSDSVEIESVQHCAGIGDGDQNWLVELSIDQRQNPSIGDESLYINVAKRGGSFRLEAVHKTHPTGCPGKTPLTPIVEHTLPGW
jgi:hypothetical protein